MKRRKPSISNIIFVIVLVLMFIPQTRKPIQVTFNKVLAQFSPGVNDKDDQVQIAYYNWDLYDEVGNVQRFSKFKDKVILVNFWATWCPPCIAEMSSLQELYDDYNDKVVFMFVTTDSREAVTAFKDKKGYTFPVYYNRSKPPTEIMTESLPTTYLIDKKGNIVIDKKGAANWNSEKVRETIDELLLSSL